MARLVHHDTVLGRLLYLCDNDRALVAVLLVELGKLREGVLAGNIGIEYEEGRFVLAQDCLGKLQGSGGTKRLGFDRKCDLDIVLLLVLRSRVSCMFFC